MHIPLWLIGLCAFLFALWAISERAGLVAVGLLLLLVGVLMFLWTTMEKVPSSS